MALSSAKRSDDQHPLCPEMTLEIGSSPMDVRRALVRATEALVRGGYGPRFRGIVELVLAEALNNIVEHAYAGQGAGRIQVRLLELPGAICLQLRDRGAPMPGLVLPEGRLKPLGHDGDLPEGGFGWYLIRRLASEVSYRRDAGENILEIAVAREPECAAEGSGGSDRLR